MPKDLTGNTAGGSMTEKRLKKLAVTIRSLRAGSANVRLHDLETLAGKLGRRLDGDRGKHLTYINTVFPRLRPLPIPSHPLCA